MFTGIILSLGNVIGLSDHQLIIDADLPAQRLGDSVAVDGCCLTVVSCETSDTETSHVRLTFDLLPETIERTRLTSLNVGAHVNLEPALRVGDALGGHWVQGHVDGTATLESRTQQAGASLDLWIALSAGILALCMDRGSVTINGVSLTVMEIDTDKSRIRVQLIPETQVRTNLGSLQPGATLNLEADVLARYIQRLLPPVE